MGFCKLTPCIHHWAQEYVYRRYTGSLVFHMDVQISQALIGKGTLFCQGGKRVRSRVDDLRRVSDMICTREHYISPVLGNLFSFLILSSLMAEEYGQV